ncbi:hypothetical protein WMY93_019058 [Mugilogobius chulae]|uniref:Secretagogin n=1 Tax=Mugilogobius chulae TaxID=88201 RepID=A0AAW0NI04_9GOBI
MQVVEQQVMEQVEKQVVEQSGVEKQVVEQQQVMEDPGAVLRQKFLSAFDPTEVRLQIEEVAALLLPEDENFLLLFRRETPLNNSVEFMRIWRNYDSDSSGFISALELKSFLQDLFVQHRKSISADKLDQYTVSMMKMFDKNRDGRLDLGDLARILALKENFLLRFQMDGCSLDDRRRDFEKIFAHYDVSRTGALEGPEVDGFVKDMMELVKPSLSGLELDHFKKLLLNHCDLNRDGKIQKNELALAVFPSGTTSSVKLKTSLSDPTTVVAVASFLDAFQKVADLASNSRGGTRDLGSALTRMCLRTSQHRDSAPAPLHSDKPSAGANDDWRRTTNSLDKDHANLNHLFLKAVVNICLLSLVLQSKKARQEIKKRSSDTLKLQKNPRKFTTFSGERGRFCCLVSMLRPIMYGPFGNWDEEVALLGEISHLQSLSDDLRTLSMDPHKLPPSSEQVLVDLKSSDCSWTLQNSAFVSELHRLQEVQHVQLGEQCEQRRLQLSSLPVQIWFRSGPERLGLQLQKPQHHGSVSEGDPFSLTSALTSGPDPQTPEQEKSLGVPRVPDRSVSSSYGRVYSAQTPGVATIRRAPKSSLRRPSLGLSPGLNLNPGPVRPPMIRSKRRLCPSRCRARRLSPGTGAAAGAAAGGSSRGITWS